MNLGFRTIMASLHLPKPHHHQVRLQRGKLLLQDHTQVRGNGIPQGQKAIRSPLLVRHATYPNRYQL